MNGLSIVHVQDKSPLEAFSINDIARYVQSLCG